MKTAAKVSSRTSKSKTPAAPSVALPISGKRSVTLKSSKGLGFGGWSDDERDTKSKIGLKRARPIEDRSPSKRSSVKR